MRRYSLLQPAFVGAAQEWRICNQGVAPLRNFPAASRPKAKLRSLLIRELAHLLPHPYWQTRLTSPFSKGETGLGTLATFFPPHSCPSHELRGSVDVKASHTHSTQGGPSPTPALGIVLANGLLQPHCMYIGSSRVASVW